MSWTTRYFSVVGNRIVELTIRDSERLTVKVVIPVNIPRGAGRGAVAQALRCRAVQAAATAEVRK
jgi:hypothetical protein